MVSNATNGPELQNKSSPSVAAVSTDHSIIYLLIPTLNKIFTGYARYQQLKSVF
jgi:hypothetical protein